MGDREYDRIREIALALPEVSERLSHGAPRFYISDKKPLCWPLVIELGHSGAPLIEASTVLLAIAAEPPGLSGCLRSRPLAADSRDVEPCRR